MTIRLKNYISWTQIETLEKSEEQYKDIYILGNKRFENSGMYFGKQIAEALEKEIETGNLMNDITISKLPKFETHEKKIEVTLKIKDEDINILCILDSAKEDLTAFKEYKTGKTQWTQKKVDTHGQITLYCLAIQAITGKIPCDIELVYMPTENDHEQQIQLTGDIYTFKTERSLSDMLKMKNRVYNAWKRIGELTEEFLI